jgi:hypothetical protein
MKKQLPTQTSLAALWGGVFAVMLLFGMEVAEPGLSVALAQSMEEVAIVSVEILDTQLAAVGSVMTEATVEVARAASTSPEENFTPVYTSFEFSEVEYFYNSDVSTALTLLREGS